MLDVDLCFSTVESRICGIKGGDRSWNNSPFAYCRLWTNWLVLIKFLL